MKTKSKVMVLGAALALLPAALPASAQPADPGWPRVFKQDKKQLTVYQPQVDYWNGYTNLHFRCAIAVKGVLKQEKFGVAEIDAVTVTDHAARIVALVPTQRDLRFPNCSDSELAALRRAVDELKPPGQALTLSLDRVLAYLDPTQHPTQPPVEVNLDPPTIFYSRRPAILVMFMGEPQFKPVETNRTDVSFALNTNWDVLYDTAVRQYYLLNGDNWLVAADVKGPWTAATSLPTSFWTLPATENWAEVRAHLPGHQPKVTPTVFVITQPAELIVTEGEPKYRSIPGTSLKQVKNTESIVFWNSSDARFYFLVAGRWFRAASLEGPWSAASKDLPADFARIPDKDPAAFVKASVPGTREARDAVLLASIPSTTTVSLTNVTVNITYTGAPQFVTIPSTTVQYAVNTPNQVFLVNGGYYWCYGGVWYSAPSATGPWSFCTSVPAAIYTIPPSNPNYNVTYVTVQSATPTTVVYSQTSGYSGEYVAATGVLMFGMGMLVGAAIAHDHDDYATGQRHDGEHQIDREVPRDQQQQRKGEHVDVTAVGEALDLINRPVELHRPAKGLAADDPAPAVFVVELAAGAAEDHVEALHGGGLVHDGAGVDLQGNDTGECGLDFAAGGDEVVPVFGLEGQGDPGGGEEVAVIEDHAEVGVPDDLIESAFVGAHAAEGLVEFFTVGPFGDEAVEGHDESGVGKLWDPELVEGDDVGAASGLDVEGDAGLVVAIVNAGGEEGDGDAEFAADGGEFLGEPLGDLGVDTSGGGVDHDGEAGRGFGPGGLPGAAGEGGEGDEEQAGRPPRRKALSRRGPHQYSGMSDGGSGSASGSGGGMNSSGTRRSWVTRVTRATAGRGVRSKVMGSKP